MFSRVFAKFFWDAYDYLGRLILANVLFFFIISGLTSVIALVLYPIYVSLNRPLPLFFALGTGLFLTLAVPFPAGGYLFFLKKISDEIEPCFRDFMAGLKAHYWRFVKVTLVFVLLFEALAMNVFFYVNPGVIPENLKLFTAIISGLCVWAMIFLLGMAMYAYPLAAHQEVGLKKTLIRSFLLVMDNVGATAATLFVMLLIWTLGFFTRGVLIFIANLALTASLVNSLYVNVMEKYELREAESKAGKKDAEGAKPTSWKQIKEKEFIEDRRKRYKRSLRDILKPWEY